MLLRGLDAEQVSQNFIYFITLFVISTKEISVSAYTLILCLMRLPGNLMI
jgi:hypothetical protein